METIPVDEFGGARCSHLNMPLVTFPVIARALKKTIDVSNEQRLNWLSHCYACEDTGIHKFTLMAHMCQDLIYEIAIFLLNHISVQISANPHEHAPPDNRSTSAHTSNQMNSQPLLDGCSYCRVTQADVQASFGDILDTCFGEFLGTVQRQSHESIRLDALFSEEIAKIVNLALRDGKVERYVRCLTDISREITNIKINEIFGITLDVISVMEKCMATKRIPAWAQGIQDCDSDSPDSSTSEEDFDIEPDPSEGCRVILPLPGNEIPGSPNFEEVEDVQEDPEATWVFRQYLSNDGQNLNLQITEVKNLEQHRAESFETTHSTKQSTDSLSRSTACPLPQLPKCSTDEQFLRMCLADAEMETIPVDEFGGARRSHLNMPLVTFPVIARVLKTRIHVLNEKELNWLSRCYACGEPGFHNFIFMTHMCQDLIYKIAIFLLKHIKSQISANPHEHAPPDNISTSAHTSNRMNSQPLLDGCSYCRVTQADVQASFGDILDTCFGEFLGTVQRRSHESIRLRALLSEEIATIVSSNLNVEEFESWHAVILPYELNGITYLMSSILYKCMATRRGPIWVQRIPDRDAVIPGSPNFEEVEDVPEDPEASCRKTPTHPCVVRQYLSNDGQNLNLQITEVKNLEQHRAESFEMTHSTKQNTDSLSRSTACPLPQLPKCSIDKQFLRICLANLIDHIAVKTHTSVANLDFDLIVTRVTESLVGEESYTTPQSVKNFHITIYKELCRKFRSKYLLQYLVENCDQAFVAAFVAMLKGQLKKSMEKTSIFKKMWRKFRGNNNVSHA